MFDYTSCARTLTTLKIDSIHYDGESVITIPNNEISPQSVVDDFEFKINSYELNQGQEMSWERGNIDTGKDVSFNLNYDAFTESAIRPLVKIVANEQGYVGCSNCFANGKIQYGAVFRGKRLRVQSYSFVMNGTINGNMDLEVVSYNGTEQLAGKESVVGTAFALIGSPGLFALQSSVLLDASAHVTTPSERITAKVGFDVEIPFSLQISSEDGLFSKPERRGSFKPKISYHEFNTTEVKITAEARMIPSVDFGFAVLGQKIGYALDLDTGVGTELAFGNPKCPLSLTLELYQFGNANLRTQKLLQNDTTTIASLARSQIACSSCKKCPVEERPHLLDQILTTSAKATSTLIAEPTVTNADEVTATTTKTRRSKRQKETIVPESTTVIIENTPKTIVRDEHSPKTLKPKIQKTTAVVETSVPQKTKAVEKPLKETKTSAEITTSVPKATRQLKTTTEAQVTESSLPTTIKEKQLETSSTTLKSITSSESQTVIAQSTMDYSTQTTVTSSLHQDSTMTSSETYQVYTAVETTLAATETYQVYTAVETTVTATETYQVYTAVETTHSPAPSYAPNAAPESSATVESVPVTAYETTAASYEETTQSAYVQHTIAPYAPPPIESHAPQYVPAPASPYSPPTETVASEQVATSPSSHAEDYAQVSPSSAHSISASLLTLIGLLAL